MLELAEAGQRLRYGDDLRRVLADLLLDWQGGRSFNAGYDQIMRETDAGREFRERLWKQIEGADTLDAAGRLRERAPDLAGRGEEWLLAAVNAEDFKRQCEAKNDMFHIGAVLQPKLSLNSMQAGNGDALFTRHGIKQVEPSVLFVNGRIAQLMHRFASRSIP